MAKKLSDGRKPGSGRKPGKAKTLAEGRKPGSGRKKGSKNAGLAKHGQVDVDLVSSLSQPRSGVVKPMDKSVTKRDRELIDALKKLSKSPPQSPEPIHPAKLPMLASFTPTFWSSVDHVPLRHEHVWTEDSSTTLNETLQQNTSAQPTSLSNNLKTGN